MPVRSLEELQREGERRLNKARHGLVDGLEAFERSETKMAEWQEQRRLKKALRDHRHGLPYLQIPSQLTRKRASSIRPSIRVPSGVVWKK